MRLTKKQIKKIKELREQGMKVREIAEKFNINPSTVCYHLDREEKLIKIRQWWNSKSEEEKKKIYKKRLPYMTEYQRRKYNEDEDFKEKSRERSRNYYARKSSNRIKKTN